MKRNKTRPIKEYAIGIYDGPHATPKESQEGPIFLGIKNFTVDGRLDFSEKRYVSENEYPKWTKRVVPMADDIVFTYEATLHRYAIISEGFRGCLGRRVALIRPDKMKVEPKYLLYYFLTPKWRGLIEGELITGATVDRIPIGRFPDFPVTLPSLPIQRKIASILSAYDDLIENNLRRIALLEESARLLYQDWFVRFLFLGYEHTKMVDGLPEGWNKVTAFDVLEVLSGGTPKTTNDEYWNGEIPFFTPKDATSSFYVFETEKSVTEMGLKTCNSRLYGKDTIFITARGTVGKLNLAQRPMAMNQSCYALIGKNEPSQYFLYCALQSSIDQFKTRAAGAVFDAIVVDTFKSIPLILPKKELIQLFNDQVSVLFRQVEILTMQNQKLKQARNLLLPKLMSGEVMV